MNATPTPTLPRTDAAGSRIGILIVIVILAGFSQGLLLPLLTVLLEKNGVSSGMNGLNAATLYIGTFIATFFVERPLRRFGYKPVIAGGIILVLVASVGFSLWENSVYWIALRLLAGMGESSLHFCTQLWIIASSPKDKRGRNISLYGMSYAIGFSIGPIGLNLLKYGNYVPFLTIAFFFAASLLLVSRLTNDFPEKHQRTDDPNRNGNRYSTVYRLAWFALVPSFLYGYMESTMNSNFPVYGLRMGLGEGWISILLPAVGLGSLVLQLPLGSLSDRIGRKKILIAAALLGGMAFLAIPWAGNRVWLILFLLGLAGGLVGSFFSLGLAYLADLLPGSLLASANVIASIHFSLGSIIGPNAGGLGMESLSLGSMFYFIGGFFLLFGLCGLLYRKSSSEFNHISL